VSFYFILIFAQGKKNIKDSHWGLGGGGGGGISGMLML